MKKLLFILFLFLILVPFVSADNLTITNVRTRNINTTFATVNWDTNFYSNSTVTYSTDFNFITFIRLNNISNVTLHEINLTNLTENTVYFYYVSSCTNATPTECSNSYTNSFATLSSNNTPNTSWVLPLFIFLIGLAGVFSYLFCCLDNEHLPYKLFFFSITMMVLTLGTNMLRIIVSDYAIQSTYVKLSGHLDNLYLIMVILLIVSAIYFFVYFTYKIFMYMVYIKKERRSS